MKKYIHLGLCCLFLSVFLPAYSLAESRDAKTSTKQKDERKASRKKPKTRVRRPEPILVLKVPADFPPPQA